jgi:hypothetical protein
VNACVRGGLGGEGDHPYHLLAGLPWRWSSFEGRDVSTAEKLAHALKTNPRLRVLVLAGRRGTCPQRRRLYPEVSATHPSGVALPRELATDA